MWLFNSSIGRKFVMSISGLCLVLFLLFHACMNLVLVFSEEGYNWICSMLGANWYALIGCAGLAFLILVHFCYALWLTIQNRAARGTSRYEMTARQWGVDWNSKNMLAIGLVILGFILLHMYNFWFKMQFAELTGIETGAFDPQNGAAYVKYLFSGVVTSEVINPAALTMPTWSHPVYCCLYLVWLCAIWFHLTHGIWSALQTLGWSNLIWFNRIKVIGYIFATLVVLLFACVPFYYLGVFFGAVCA